MGYAVLHLNKVTGNDAATSAHIERTIDPKNADKTRSHLNRELLAFPDGIKNRTEAIQNRIDSAGITRKIGKNQVRALRVMLSGTHEDMKQIEADGKLTDWCDDNVEWLKNTFGAENLVSAVLHLDEKTPHIHATVVPIVTGKRRKAKNEQAENQNKKKYKKKNANAARLCADDVMARNKLKEYQSSYAEAMNKYGLKRGVDGSEAKHISNQQYYRDLYVKNENLKENIEILQEQKEDVYEKVRDMYDHRDEARDKFLEMDKHLHQKEQEVNAIEARLQKAKLDYEPYRAQEDLNMLFNLFPKLKEQLQIANYCEKTGLALESVKALFLGKTLTAKSFSFFSPEHNQKFIAENINLKIENAPDNQNKLRLNLNGINITDWFREKYQNSQTQQQPANNQNIFSVSGNIVSAVSGLFDFQPSGTNNDYEETEFQRQQRIKKKKIQR